MFELGAGLSFIALTIALVAFGLAAWFFSRCWKFIKKIIRKGKQCLR